MIYLPHYFKNYIYFYLHFVDRFLFTMAILVDLVLLVNAKK